MAALKVWAEACVLAGDVEFIADALNILAEIAETKAIYEAYQEGILAETRREAREARAAAASVGATTMEGASAGKSKAAKRKQQKRKAQQQKKLAAEAAAAAAAAAAGAAAAAAAVESSRGDQNAVKESKEGEESRQQQLELIGDLAAATLGLTLQGEVEVEEAEEVEEERKRRNVPSACACFWIATTADAGLFAGTYITPRAWRFGKPTVCRRPSSRPVLIAGRPRSLNRILIVRKEMQNER